MASDAERAKIMAEYMAGLENDDGAEADFDDYELSDGDEDDNNNAWADEDNDDDDYEEGGLLVISLAGKVSIAVAKMENNIASSGKRLVYKGMWDNKSKFKLKSRPLEVKNNESDEDILKDPSIAAPKDTCTFLFDGFYENDGMKVREFNVEIMFNSKQKVRGRGNNEFGSFILEGSYDPKTRSMTMSKTYGGSFDQNKKRLNNDDVKVSAKKKKENHGVDDDEEYAF